MKPGRKAGWQRSCHCGTELAHGDLRCLYLGWLAAVGSDEVDDDEPEHPASPQSEDDAGARATRRTVGELLDAADDRTENRRQHEMEEQARQEAARLDRIAARETEICQEVEALITEKKASGYVEAIKRLADLRDLAERDRESSAFDERIRELRARTRQQEALQQRLDAAGFAKR